MSQAHVAPRCGRDYSDVSKSRGTGPRLFCPVRASHSKIFSDSVSWPPFSLHRSSLPLFWRLSSLELSWRPSLRVSFQLASRLSCGALLLSLPELSWRPSLRPSSPASGERLWGAPAVEAELPPLPVPSQSLLLQSIRLQAPPPLPPLLRTLLRQGSRCRRCLRSHPCRPLYGHRAFHRMSYACSPDGAELRIT